MRPSTFSFIVFTVWWVSLFYNWLKETFLRLKEQVWAFTCNNFRCVQHEGSDSPPEWLLTALGKVGNALGKMGVYAHVCVRVRARGYVNSWFYKRVFLCRLGWSQNLNCWFCFSFLSACIIVWSHSTQLSKYSRLTCTFIRGHVLSYMMVSDHLNCFSMCI